MTELRNWYFKEYAYEEESKSKYIVKGVVYGHTSALCPDGLFIHTSTVQSVTDKGDILEVQTHNTLYTLKKSLVAANYYAYDVNEQKKQALSDCLKHFMGAQGEELFAQLHELILAALGRVREKAQALENGSMLLSLSADSKYYFDSVYCKNSVGEVKMEKMYVHLGMFQDSVLLADGEARYFPYKNNSVEFYDPFAYASLRGEPADVERVYVCNSGSKPLRIRFTWGKEIELAPNETILADPEALSSLPDAPLLSREDLYSPSWINEQGNISPFI